MEDAGGIDRLYERNYLPTDQDILRARLRTTGISETLFNIGPYTYRMFDVGGQRSERKKWIHVFDNVQVVLFLVAISGYDHALVEDRNGVSFHASILFAARLTQLLESNARSINALRIHRKLKIL
jgi:guanine nucleotide-binding protein subunit alpha